MKIKDVTVYDKDTTREHCVVRYESGRRVCYWKYFPKTVQNFMSKAKRHSFTDEIAYYR